MKTSKKFFTIVCFTGALGLISCQNKNETGTDKDAKDVAEQHNDAKFNTHKSEKDAQFIVDAADVSLAEMNLGQLAESKATTKEVKDLGSMMNKDHKKAYDEVASLAAKKTISIPSSMSESTQKDYNKLAEKTGYDFDKEFCDMMVKGHKDAISKFEKASNESADADIQAWASNTLPTLRMHLDHAINCQDKVKNLK